MRIHFVSCILIELLTIIKTKEGKGSLTSDPRLLQIMKLDLSFKQRQKIIKELSSISKDHLAIIGKQHKELQLHGISRFRFLLAIAYWYVFYKVGTHRVLQLQI